jgi:hypothetical protein
MDDETKAQLDAARRVLSGTYNEPREAKHMERTEITQAHYMLLSRIIVGSCSCMTKTPELQYHRADCDYRLASEISHALAQSETVCNSYAEENQRLSDEAQEFDGLNERLKALLDGVCLAFKGPNPENGLHSWHDLPDIAVRVMRDREVMRTDKFVADVWANHGHLDELSRESLYFQIGAMVGLIARRTEVIK